jgi:hypothetical protein
MRLPLNPPIFLDDLQPDLTRSIDPEIVNDIPAAVPARRRNTPLRILVCVVAVIGFLFASLVLLGNTLGCG